MSPQLSSFLPPPVYFSSYELLRRVVPGRQEDRGAQRTLWEQAQDAASAILCGGLAGMAMWAAVLPLDVAKTRVQTAYPGSPADVGLLRQLRRLHAEGAQGGRWQNVCWPAAWSSEVEGRAGFVL